MMKETDCIIIGQGIAGTLLSFELMEAGYSVLVIDSGKPHGASRVASGVINPVTGRRVVETWKIGDLLPLAADTYARVSQFLGLETVARDVDALSVHNNEQMLHAYEKRIQEKSRYVFAVEETKRYETYFNLPFGMHAIHPVLLVDLQKLLSVYRDYLVRHDLLWQQPFDWGCLQLSRTTDEPVYYKYGGATQIKAKWLITAEGAAVAQNPYFKDLAFRYNKGEALIIAAPDLPRAHIYKLRYSIVPWGEKDLFWVGSDYQWTFEDSLPTASFKESVFSFLKEELLVPFEVLDHIASVRPATVNRRPFAGFHNNYPRLGILNGLGTKGCSLAPYLAAAWREHLRNGKPFDTEVALDNHR